MLAHRAKEAKADMMGFMNELKTYCFATIATKVSVYENFVQSISLESLAFSYPLSLVQPLTEHQHAPFCRCTPVPLCAALLDKC
jgi:hypothetical protein